MNVWLPIVAGGSGVEVFTRELSSKLGALGHTAIVEIFPHSYQYAPWLLKNRRAPAGTEAIIGNSWNAFAFKRDGIPLVSIQHLFVLDEALRPYKSLGQHFFHTTLVRHFEQRTAALADKLVAVSDYTGRSYREFLGNKPVQVIRNGIDTQFFSPSHTQKDRPRDKFHLLFVGNFTRRKGADMLPAIMDKLGASFSLSYTSGLRVKDERPTRTNMLPLGRLNKEQTRDAYRKADVLIFPTRLEGLPLVALEAMACGTPVVATDGSSLPEVVTSGIDGLLCPQDDTQAFADTVAWLSKNADELEAMGKRARETIVGQFSLDRMTAQYAHLLSEL